MTGERAEPRLARIAALVADATRSRMLCLLLGGESASAGDLAEAAGVTAATASGHLARLLDGGLIACESRGRHRYYRLADAEVAHALEALALVAERGSHERAWARPARARLRDARCCYGHLAGRLGVALLDGWLERGWLQREDDRFRLSADGARAVDRLGLDGGAWQGRLGRQGRIREAYPCLDWSERRDHLAGAFAVALRARFEQLGWLHRMPGDRAVRVTAAGAVALGELTRQTGRTLSPRDDGEGTASPRVAARR